MRACQKQLLWDKSHDQISTLFLDRKITLRIDFMQLIRFFQYHV